MSDFLEQVFAAQANQASPRRRRRKRDEGFTGGRYAVMLTLMAGLTAVPTWVMLRAGAEGLDQPAVSGVQPLLLPHGVPDTAPPVEPKSPAVAQREPQAPVRQQPPEPVVVPPVLEGRSYVDTGARPVQKKRPKTTAQQPETPATTDAPVSSAPTTTTAPVVPSLMPPTTSAPVTPNLAPPTTTTAPVVPNLSPPAAPMAPNLTPPTFTPPRTRIAEPPRVIRPEPPQLNDLRARS